MEKIKISDLFDLEHTVAKELFLKYITEKAKNEETTIIYVSHNTEEFIPIFNKVGYRKKDFGSYFRITGT